MLLDVAFEVSKAHAMPRVSFSADGTGCSPQLPFQHLSLFYNASCHVDNGLYICNNKEVPNKMYFLIIVSLIMMSPHSSRTVVTALYVSCDQNGFQASFLRHCPFPPLVSSMIAQA